MRRWIGLGILAVVALGAVVVTQLDLDALRRAVPQSREPVDVTIFYGGEKQALLRNPGIERILRDDYAITLDARKAGSIEMVTTLDTSAMSCLWPSNTVAVELARQSGKQVLSAETIFTSPIVFYAWGQVADAFAEKGIVREREDGFLVADVAKLGAVLDGEHRWREDLGLNIFGTVSVWSTDPRKSNSGNIWMGLLATMLNGGRTPGAEDLAALEPKIEAYFARLGYMESSSGDIFENFLKQGMGARPIIVGYENQLLEFLIENEQAADLIREKIRVIYPEPTIYASHPLIALTPACRRLQEALLSQEVQDLAWADHGFRTGLIGVENDAGALTAVRLPERVELVVPMPPAEVQQRLVAAIP